MRIYKTKYNLGFHTKGYIFKYNKIYEILIGSSNLTQSALSLNHEWNINVQLNENNELIQNILNEYNNLWESANTANYTSFIDDYKIIYENNKKEKNKLLELNNQPTIIEANEMQKVFVKNLVSLYNNNQSKGLLISATGTGKTYACMLGLKAIKPKKVLFVVHRDIIAQQAFKTCSFIFDDKVKKSLIIGDKKEFDGDYIFATYQALDSNNKKTNEAIYKIFNQNYFDFVVVDEAHHIGASTYKHIVDYFKPRFLLGLSATPERNDNFDTFAYFDNNIVHEIRLKEALEQNYLCPFHYFALTDIELIDDNSKKHFEANQFNKLNFEYRVDKIISAATYYGYRKDKIIGLIFCSTINEALELEKSFNNKGFKTKALSGSNTTQKQREEYIERLYSDNFKDKLHYLICVDIFNEGIDIPKLNQIIMLRPTKSATIFIQQLGRGLRKADNKEYVIILDFIANYDNNYMIPIALSGNTNLDKEDLRCFIHEANKFIPGASSISIEEIAKERILKSLDKAKLTGKRLLESQYINFAQRFKTYPTLCDFIENDFIDPNIYFKQYYSLHTLQCKTNAKLGNKYDIVLSNVALRYIEYICRYIANGKRLCELEILSSMIDGNTFLESLSLISNKNEHVDNVVNFLTNTFDHENIYKEVSFIQQNPNNTKDYELSNDFKKVLNETNFIKIYNDIAKYNQLFYKKQYSKQYKNTGFCLYKQYTYFDVERIIGVTKKNPALNIGGYKFYNSLNILPIFINYHKDKNIKDSINYNNKFISKDSLIWYSKGGFTTQSESLKPILEQSKYNTTLLLFIRRDNISKEKNLGFYFLGEVFYTGKSYNKKLKNNDSVVEFELKLETAVDEAIYDYIVYKL